MDRDSSEDELSETRPVDRSLPTDGGATNLSALDISAVAPTLDSHATAANITHATLDASSAGSATALAVRGALPTGAPTGERGSLIGRFIVLHKLGEGGMGVVYAAYDDRLDRKIAIKLLSAAYQGGTALARLQREARGLARVSHPNVVQIHETGTHGDAVFIAMEYIEGHTLREWLEAEPGRGWKEILAKLVQAGRGLAAAHEQKLVHRDFKPDNVMVADDGRVRVLDFGLVRRLGAEDEDQHETVGEHRDSLADLHAPADRPLTRVGAIMGTPAYMALEQLEGKPSNSLTDQFAFCVVAFEALYGLRPFEGETGTAVAVRMHAGEIQARPDKSEVPRAVHEAIVRGIAADPAARWPDMAALLEILDASLAEPPSRRWMWLSAGAIATVVALVVIATPLVRSALAERDQTIAEQVEHIELKNETLRQRNLELEQRNLELQRQFDIQGGLTASLLANSPGRASEGLALAIKLFGRYHSRGETPPLPIEVGMFAATRHLHAARELSVHDEPVVDLAFSPDGRRVATASRDDTAKLWDAATGELLRTFSGHVDDLRAVEFSPEGDRLLTTSADATATIWLLETGKVLATIDSVDVERARFSPDGQLLAIAGGDGSLSLWSSAPGEEIAEQRSLAAGATITALSFSPDSQRIAAAERDGPVRLWSVGSGSTLASFATAGVEPRTLRFSPDGSRLAAAGPDATIALRDGHTGAAIANLATGYDKLAALAFSPSRRGEELRLIAAGRPGSPKLWSASSGELVAVIDEHAEAATDVAFSPDGRVCATVSYDARLRICDPDSGRVLETLDGQRGQLDRVVFSPDGARIASLGIDRYLRLWSTERVAETELLRPTGREVTAAGFAPDRARVALGERDGVASVWSLAGDADDDAPALELDHEGVPVYGVVFSPDGAKLATGDAASTARIWDARSGALEHTLGPHRGGVKALAFSPDTRLLATADMSGTLRTWTASSGAREREWQADELGVVTLAFAPDGTELATAGLLRLVSVWSVASGERSHLLAIDGPLFGLAYSPDGRRLAVVGAHEQIEIWDLEREAAVVEILGEDPSLDAVAFAPDGARILTAGGAWARVWDLETERLVADFARHEANVIAVAFAPDGRTLSVDADGVVVATNASALERFELACRALRGTRAYSEDHVIARTCDSVLL